MIIPTEGRLVLQKIKEEEPVSKGGLILPSSQPKQDRYLICDPYPNNVANADKVVYIEKYKGVEITRGGQVYLVVKEEDIIAYEAN